MWNGLSSMFHNCESSLLWLCYLRGWIFFAPHEKFHVFVYKNKCTRLWLRRRLDRSDDNSFEGFVCDNEEECFSPMWSWSSDVCLVCFSKWFFLANVNQLYSNVSNVKWYLWLNVSTNVERYEWLFCMISLWIDWWMCLLDPEGYWMFECFNFVMNERLRYLVV